MKRFIADFGYFALFLSITVLLVSMLPATIGIALAATWFSGLVVGVLVTRRQYLRAAKELDKENNNGAA